MKFEITTKNYAETEALGRKLAQNFKGREVVILSSDLGGGKTTFTRGIAAGLNSVDAVSSPTFTVSQVYDGGRLRVLHIDMYRLTQGQKATGDKRHEGVDDLSLLEDEGIGESDTVTVIEWATDGMSTMHPNALIVAINKDASSDEVRSFVFSCEEQQDYLLLGLDTNGGES